MCIRDSHYRVQTHSRSRPCPEGCRTILSRTCSRCDTLYDDYGQRSAMCRPCKRVYDREYHSTRSARAKEHKLLLQRRRLDTTRARLNSLKEDAGCADCGVKDPRVLEFDHLPGFDKKFNVSDALRRGFSWGKILAELEKCEVVCACLLYTSPSPRDATLSRMPSSA